MPAILSPISVLILEDNETDAELLLYSLSQSGLPLENRIARSQDEFLAALDASVPDVILADFSLPQFTALEAVRILKEKGLTVPLIVITGVLGDEMAAECIKQGARDYLVKDRLGRLPRALQQAMEVAHLERESRARHREILESERRFRTLADTIPQMIWTATPAGDREYCNARWSDYTGISPVLDPEPDSWWTQFLHDDDRGECIVRWRSSLLTGKGFQAECRVRRASDGAYRWFLCRAFAQCNENQHPTRWFGSWTDIDDEKKNSAALLQREKMDGIGLLAAGVAHDFNNLLASILGAASFATECVPPEHRVRPLLDIVVEASERAAQLTKQLLAYAGKDQVFREPVSFAKLLPETCALLRSSLSRRIHITHEVAENLPSISADRSQLQRVVMNLMINAAEAIGDNPGVVAGRATVLDIGQSTPAEAWVNGPPPDGRYVVLEVTDTGAGMDAATLSKIFDPFYTTKVTGRGLGLASVAGIVRSCGGAIALTSTPGQGTTFRLAFPSTDAQPDPLSLQQPAATLSVIDFGILIVDDEKIVRDTLSAMASHLGAQPMLAEEGGAGVKLFAEHQNEISLVILDVNMPGQSLVETIEGLRNVRADVPILLVTGYSSLEVATYINQFGRMHFFAKPFRMNDLKKAILAIMEP